MVIIEKKDESFSGQKVKISLTNGMYYKGTVLSEGEDWIKLRDIKDNIVFVKIDAIKIIEGWRG